MFHRIKSIFRLKPVLLTITILAALFLQTLPLTNSLDYEFSALMGFWYFIAGGIFIIKSGYRGEIKLFLKKNYIYIAALILIPLLISLTSTIFLSLCPLRQGIQFFSVISIISFLLGIITGLSAIRIALKHHYFLLFFFIAGFILVSVLEIYCYPQIFTFNPLIGFIPGTIYDELIELDYFLISYRIYNLLLFGGLLFAADFIRRRKPEGFLVGKAGRLINIAYSISFALIFFLIYWILNLLFGFTVPISKIESELGGRLETEHFIIIYPGKIEKEKALLSALHHEFYYSLVSGELDVNTEGKITSILFPSPEIKKRLIGSANADMAKPWMNLIITDFDNQDRTLKHELVHALSSRFGGAVFKMPYGFNPVLLEGLASAVENKFDIYDLDAAAFMIRRYKEKISVGSLFSGFNFFGQSSAVAYAYSGAFVRFLIERYGIDKFKRLYTDPDFGKYYGKSVTDLENEFKTYIDSMDYKYNTNAALLYLSGKPVFMKKCPRYAAYGMKMGNEKFREGKYEKAFDWYSDIYSVTESYSPLSGMANSLIRLKKVKEALNLLEREKEKFSKSNNRFILQIQLADLYFRNNMFPDGGELLDSLIAENPHPDYYFISSLKKKLLVESETSVKEYAEGEISEKKKIVLESKALSPLMKAYWLVLNGEGINEVPNNIFDDLIPGNEFELRMILGTAKGFKDSGKFEEAAKLLSIVRRYSGKGIPFMRIIEEDIEKINYFRKFKDQILESIKFSNE